MIAQVYEATGDLMKAIDEYELGLETEHDAEAKRFWEELREAARKGGPEGYYRRQLELRLTGSKPNSYWVAESYAALQNKDEAYKWLDKAVEERRGEIGDQMMISLYWDHNDKPFKDIARRVGLMQ